MIPVLRVLDLFSGLRGWTAAFEAFGHHTFSIDNDRRFMADAYLDIGDTDAVMRALPWRPDVILASPPCTSFSTMTMGRMWTPEGEPKHPAAVEGRRLVLATIRLIAALEPTWWVIENPRARLRTLGLMDGFDRRTVTYCRLGETRMKPTDLWIGGRDADAWQCLELPPMCHNGDPDPVAAPRGSVTGTQGGIDPVVSAKIPLELSRRVMAAIHEKTRSTW